MNCQDVSRILDTTDNASLDPAARTEMNAHADSCPLCADALRGAESVASVRIPGPPADLFARIVQACNEIEPGTAQSALSGRLFLLGSLLIAGAAAAAILIVQSRVLSTDMDVPVSAQTSSTQAQDSGTSTSSPAVVSIPDSESRSASPEQEDASNAVPDIASLDRFAVVVLPVTRTLDDVDVAEAAELFHQKLVQRLLDEGFTVYSSGAVTPYILAGLEDVEIARIFGAATVVVLGIADSPIPDRPPSVSYEFVDAETERMLGAGILVYTAVAQMEQSFSQMPAGMDVFSRLDDLMRRRIAPDPESAPSVQQRVAAYTATILDTSLTDDERMRSLSLLRGAQGVIQQDDVVFAAIAIAANSEDANTRASVWQQLRGSGNRYLLQPLLQAVASETDEFARSQAVTTLGDFGDEPAVRQALDAVERDDPSSRVREAAEVAKLSEAELVQSIRQRVLDTNLPVGERIRALINPFGDMRFGFGPAVPIDREIADAFLEIAQDEADPNRVSAIGIVGQASDPAVAGPLVQLLTGDSDQAVRQSAASALRAFVSEPGVRQALENARDTDPDRGVRGAAGATLEAAP